MGPRVPSFVFSLLMVAVAVGDTQLQMQEGAAPYQEGAAPYRPACKDTEEFQQCGCLKTCCNRGEPEGCASECTSGCFCKDGLVKNKNGDCIPLKDCNKTEPPTPVCGANEEHYGCVPTCRNTCETYNLKTAICPQYCRAGCFCKKGWVKNSEGKCVPTSQCKPPTEEPPRCPKDEEFYPDCAPSCTGTCQSYNTRGNYHCPLCRPGCWCKKGLVRENNGMCIDPSKCDVPTDKCNGSNEALVDCVKWCNTCQIKGNCKLKDCVKGCDCKPNYYRNETGICIPESQCPGSTPRCGEDEVYYEDCAPSCRGRCETYGKDAEIFCPRCLPGCWCKDGLVKDKNGKCIPFSKCDKPQDQCGEDEVYNECGTACPRTCKNLYSEIACIALCKKGCFCRVGLVRNDDGKCVEPSKCPKGECGVGEVYKECGTACPRTCKNLNAKIKCTADCKKGCFCRDGLVRNDDGKCVEPNQCPNVQCEAGEEYRQCGSSCPATCSNLGKPQVCTDECVSGCFCMEGLVKDDNGKCVEPNECTIEECGENEEYTTCGSACPETCEDKDKTILCTLQCVPGCFCIKGFVKNAKGKCINASQCEPSNAKNTNTSLTRTRSARSPSNSERPDCDKAPDAGPCRAVKPRFYYDKNSNECKPFNYGGCKGNSNNFKSEDDCYKKCGSKLSEN